ALNKSYASFLSIMPQRVRVYTRALDVMSSTSRKAAISATLLRGAFKTLLVGTGIGLIIGGVSAAMSLFSKKTDEAAEAAAEARREFDDWKKSLTDLSSLTQQEAAKEMLALERLYKVATDETKSRKERVKAAIELKNTYKDTFGALKTEAILAGKAAEAYDKQKKAILELATAKAAQAKIEQNQAEWLDLEMRKNDLQDKQQRNVIDITGAEKRLSEVERNNKYEEVVFRPGGSSLGGNSGYGADNTTKEYRDAKNNLDNLREENNNIQTELNEIVDKQAEIDKAREFLENYVNTSSTTAAQPTNNLDDLLKDTDKNTTYKQRLEKQLSEAKDRYVKASIAGNQAEIAGSKAVIDSLRQQIKEIERYEALAERPTTLTTLEDIDAEIKYQQKLRETASQENIAAIDAEIERLEELKKAMLPSKVKPLDQIKTYEELDATRQHYSERMQTASEAERIEIQKIINQLDKMREAWDEALVEAPGDISTLDTLKKLSDAISYYENKLEKATESEMAGYQKTLAALRQKQSLMQRSQTIATAQTEVDDINSAQGRDWYVKVNAIGFDALSQKIRDIQALLKDTKNPLSDDMRRQAEDIVKQYRKMRTASLASAKGFQQVWGTTKGLAGGLQSMKSALTESDDAWSKVSGTIDSAIQVYESVMQVIDIISALTDGLTLRKKAEKVATEEETLAVVEGAGAKVAAATAESAAAAANTTAQVGEAAAKTMSAHASIPWVGIAIGSAMVAAMLATMFALPKFANGGIISGPTVGLMGEYPGAANNPEVVAPLNKLRTLLQPVGVDATKYEFVIKGSNLVAVAKKVEHRSSRV
ncbi:MAG: hypothetical protein K2J06_04625, partial [Muribaculaceae bacterium]|nr:hypothetical protein [Muribaculaceae bacterium]